MSEMPSVTASMLNLDRPKPHNEDAEVAVLGGMMLSIEAASIAITGLRLENAFYRPANQTIFNAMVELSSGKGDISLDPIVIADHLDRSGKLEEVGGRAYILQLLDSVPTAANIEFYVDIVKQNAILRHIIATCTETIQRCYSGDEDVHALLELVEQKIFEVTSMNETKELQTIQPLALEAINYLEKLATGDADVLGLKTGFDFDKMITGLMPGEMFVLAARPSIGKTALALNMASNIALNPSHKAAVGIFSLEMPALALVLRMICSLARIGLSEFKSGAVAKSKWQAVMTAASELNKAQFIIDDTGAIDILELRAKARRMKSKHNVEVIFVDYLQLIRAHTKSNASRENEVSMISGSLKAMAKELNIPVVVLAQLNRQAEQGEKPKLSQLRESGAIEQDADVVALLHRERERQQEQRDGDNAGLPSEVIIAKNRNGATGTSELLFFPRYTRFENKGNAGAEDMPGATGEF